jgi:hypothetical protein
VTTIAQYLKERDHSGVRILANACSPANSRVTEHLAFGVGFAVIVFVVVWGEILDGKQFGYCLPPWGSGATKSLMKSRHLGRVSLTCLSLSNTNDMAFPWENNSLRE